MYPNMNDVAIKPGDAIEQRAPLTGIASPLGIAMDVSPVEGGVMACTSWNFPVTHFAEPCATVLMKNCAVPPPSTTLFTFSEVITSVLPAGADAATM